MAADIPTKLLPLFTGRPSTATLPVVLLSNFRTRDMCHQKPSVFCFFFNISAIFILQLGIHHRVNCKKRCGIHHESKLIFAYCVFLCVPHACVWLKICNGTFLRDSYFNIIWNKMRGSTRSVPKMLTKTFRKEIRLAIQPLHLTMTFCITHTFPSFVGFLCQSF